MQTTVGETQRRAHRRKGHVQRYSRHSCDQRIRARVGQGRPLQDFPMTH